VSERDRLDHLVRLRVDAHDGAVEAVRDPDPVVGYSDPERTPSDANRL
jgi:hypothetical protein